MLRIITQQAEAKTELQRIRERISTDEIRSIEIVVKEILETVKNNRNRSIVEYSKKWDLPNFKGENLRVSGSEIDAAYQQISRELLEAIKLASDNIEAFHRQHLPKSWVKFEENDVVLGKRYTPVDKAGLYISGEKTSSTTRVLMNGIPAKVARVPRIVMVTPPGIDGKINPAVLVAATEAGINEIYRIGGAMAIAALAYGTETIPKVDLIVGEGDIYVTLAKKMLSGIVGVDLISGPSDLLIIADSHANAQYIAADLLAKAETDIMAAAILITDDLILAKKVQQEVIQQLQNHPRKILTEKSIAHYGLIIVVDSLMEAIELSNLFAPEYLELEVMEPWDMLENIRHAGAILLGNSTPEAVANYLAGTNDSLPRNGYSRYTSGLGVETFMTYSSLIQYSPVALKKIASAIEILAKAEDLPSRGNSIKFRTEGNNPD